MPVMNVFAHHVFPEDGQSAVVYNYWLLVGSDLAFSPEICCDQFAEFGRPTPKLKN